MKRVFASLFSSLRSRINSMASSKRLLLWICLLTFVLMIPALSAGFMLDDYPQRLTFWPQFRFPGGPRGDWDLFHFQGPDRSYFQHHLQQGLWPWWTTPNLRLAFFRPLSSLHHALDYRLWPDAAWLMHLESLFLFFGIVYVLGTLYQRLLGVTLTAALAVLMFAVDDAHSMVVMWIANRNALWAVLFSAMALLCFIRYRQGSFPSGKLVGPLCFALGLLSGETAVGAAAYLFAYVVWMEQGPLRTRLLSLLPYALIGVLWAATYKLLGYGSAGSGMYIDPASEPLHYLSTVLIRLPLLLLAQLGLPPADVWMQTPTSILPAAAFVASLCLGVFSLLCYRVLKLQSHTAKTAAFFATGMTLSLLPVCAVWPGDRLLLCSGLGAFGLLSQLITVLWQTRAQHHGIRRALRSAIAISLLLIHIALASVLLPLRISFLASTFGSIVPRAAATLPPSELFPDHTLVMLNAPDPLVAVYSVSYRFLQTQKLGDAIRLLSVVQRGSLLVTRTDEKTLVLEPSEGFLHDPLSSVFRSPSLPMSVGQQVTLSNMTATVLSVSPQGIPTRVAFRFERVLEDSSYLWVIWKDRGFVPFPLPRIGQIQLLPAIDYQLAMGMK